MSSRILVVDDDKDINELICVYLRSEGYSVEKAFNGKEALKMIQSGPFDLIILDIMMPEMDGIQTLIELRKTQVMPVIFLTAKNTEIDLLQGLTLGADDYIAKPFSSIELLVRVKAQLRRFKQYNNVNQEQIVISDLALDVSKHMVTVKNKEVKLTPTEYRILELLCQNRGKVFSIEEIYESLWNNKSAVNDTSIVVHITKLRQKIEKDSKNPEYIKTVWGVGYKV